MLRALGIPSWTFSPRSGPSFGLIVASARPIFFSRRTRSIMPNFPCSPNLSTTGSRVKSGIVTSKLPPRAGSISPTKPKGTSEPRQDPASMVVASRFRRLPGPYTILTHHALFRHRTGAAPGASRLPLRSRLAIASSSNSSSSGNSLVILSSPPSTEQPAAPSHYDWRDCWFP